MNVRTPAAKRLVWPIVFLLITVVMVFLVIRVTNDVSNLSTGEVPAEGEFDRRYALNPVLAYAHIVPGVVYLLGAPLQLSARLRSANIGLHRALGRLVLPAGIVTGVFAIAVGIVMPFGGLVEASATVVFGIYFLAGLVLAYRHIRRLDVTNHRRWMIRAFAVGLGVGTIRVWVGLFQGFSSLTFADSFGLSFWIAFSLHALAAELWLRWRPDPYSMRSPAPLSL